MSLIQIPAGTPASRCSGPNCEIDDDLDASPSLMERIDAHLRADEQERTKIVEDLQLYLQDADADLRRRLLNHAGLRRDFARTIGEIEAGAQGTGLQLLDDVELENMPPIKYLVDGVFPTNSLLAIYGPPGSGKSFVALDLAACIATGREWHTHAVHHRGPVVYVAAEGSAGLGARVGAWKSANRCEGERIGIYCVREAINLLEPVAMMRLIDGVARHELDPVLVVFDTLHRSMPGGEENSARDVGLVIAAADRVRRDTGAAVLFVHHSRKDSDVERGSTALRGAVDALVQLKADDEQRQLLCEKAKDAPPFEPIGFTLVPHGNSCVVREAKIGETNGAISLTPRDRTCLTSLSLCSDGGEASTSTWQEVSNLPKPSFYRCVSRLKAGGYVTLRTSGRAAFYALTDAGKLALVS